VLCLIYKYNAHDKANVSEADQQVGRLQSQSGKLADDGTLEISLLAPKGATYAPLKLASFHREYYLVRTHKCLADKEIIS
jgi:hypothetical protein